MRTSLEQKYHKYSNITNITIIQTRQLESLTAQQDGKALRSCAPLWSKNITKKKYAFDFLTDLELFDHEVDELSHILVEEKTSLAPFRS